MPISCWTTIFSYESTLAFVTFCESNAKVLLTVRQAFYQKSFAAAVPLHPFNAASVIWGGKEAANAARQDSRAVTFVTLAHVTNPQNRYHAVGVKKYRLPPSKDRLKSFGTENGAGDFHLLRS